MRLKLISCEVLYREMCDSVARSPHQVDVEFLHKGLHDLGGARMRDELQKVVDSVDAGKYDAVLMGYALCGNGLFGLAARELRLVVPRAHDCIALLMGSRQEYQKYFDANPGVYFRSTGWLERGYGIEQLSMKPRTGAGFSLEELIAQYGEDNGRYLFEEMNRYQQHYRQLTYIETGLEPNGSFEDRARTEAAERGWNFTKIPGKLTLFRQLVNGEWPEADFLVVPPQHRIRATYGDDIIGIEKATLL